jgi:hypothetical protein
MNHSQFIEHAKELVKNYTNDHSDKSDGQERLITTDNVFVVWSAKVLQNSKALLSTTQFDGMYYEVTLNGNKGEIYFDAYKKFQNIVHKVEV